MRVLETTPSRRADARAGFTLIELGAAIALVAIIFSLLPAVQRLRETHNKNVAESTLRAIGTDLEARFRKSGQMPTNLDEILQGSGSLIERKAGGYDIVAVELKPALVRLAAQPIPGVTGSQTGFLEVGIGPAGVYKALNFAKTAGADEARNRMFDEAHEAVARAFGRLVGLASKSDAASALKGVKADAENPARIGQEFNAMKGADGKVSFGSMEAYLTSSPATTSNPSAKAIFQQLAQDFHRTFRLGALGEQFGQLPGASVPPVVEITDRFFNFTRLAQLTAKMLVDPNIRLVVDPNFRYVIDPNIRTIIDPNVLNGLLGYIGHAQASEAANDVAGQQKALATYVDLLSSSSARQFQWGVVGPADKNPYMPFQDAEALRAVATAMK
jgi:Tfp pilus assembly protein PilE